MKKIILFVDDEPQVLQSLSITFQKAYDVLTTTNGHEAIDLVKRKPISVVISDQRMPHMLGHELLREVKAINPAAMRILLTGYADIEAIMASVNIGDVFRFVNKPWKNDKLRETVALAVELSEKTTRLSVEHQLITSAENSDIFQGVSHSTMHILVVDTNPVHLQAISEVFINECIVHTARTAEAAFQTLKTLPVAVVITDTQIGETDGVDFLAAVREDYADVVPILLSDSKDASVAIRLINE
ncbi:MAG: response regulator, partial [Rhizobacter sp.]|nr:response regulator [Chlorobiales bacterium]